MPIDPLSPIARCRTLLGDCSPAALIASEQRAAAVLTGELAGLPWLAPGAAPAFGAGVPPPDHGGADDDLAFILYTSGSTGKPKGVAISHRNAMAFTGWAVRQLDARPSDRFANHAPLHFDLSVLDLYAAFQVGAAVQLIPDSLSFAAGRLVRFIAEQQPTIWYSVPSVLILMMEHGGLLDLAELPPRVILFAGEPFPTKHLRRLRERWPAVRLLNLYGPTETNVCTFHEVGSQVPPPDEALPIGRACSGDRVWARRGDGQAAGPGEIGELIVEGPTVMLGYWGREPQAAAAYATGDLARVLADGSFEFLGRRDHMVKVRGQRIELGEIEAALLQHPALIEGAVMVNGAGLDARLVAYLVAGAAERPSVLAIKQHCAARLPRHMIVDRVHYLAALPRTRTGKIDRLALATRAAPAGAPPPAPAMTEGDTAP